MKRMLLCLCAWMMLFSCAIAEEFPDFSSLYPDKFLPAGAETIKSETAYQSENICLTISHDRADRSDVFVADVYVRSVQYLQRAFAGDKWSTKMQKVATIAQNKGALLALTGDNAQNFSKGLVFANGVRLRKSGNNSRDLCVLYKNGEMQVLRVRGDDAKEFLAQNEDAIWQSFLFGPGLLDGEGHARVDFTSTVATNNPRSAIGYIAPGHYVLVQVDGRGTTSTYSPGSKNAGMTLKQLASYMEGLSCKAAYNLDGGQSSLMWYDGSVISVPYKGGRAIGDVIILTENIE